MAAQDRFLYGNEVMESEAVLTPSSEARHLPATNLQDQLRQKVWRSETGWTIETGVNDTIDFNRGGVKVATVAAGTYATGAALAAAIVTALEAADSTPVWGCDYGVAAANKFRIRDSGGAPLNSVLLFGTGANLATSIALDLGFLAADTANVASHTADGVSYQSRHYLKINRSDGETIDVTSIALLDHNFSLATGSELRMQGHGSDTWGAPATNVDITPISSNADPLVYLIALAQRAWWRLVINDVGNSAGYSELGILYLGTSQVPDINVDDSLADAVEDFSSLESGIDGTHFLDQHRRRDRWTLEWLAVDATTRDQLDAIFAANQVGRDLFLVWSAPLGTLGHVGGPADGETGATYGFFAAGVVKQYVPVQYWTYAVPFHEAL